MPILWRYLLRSYLQVFGLSLSCFIAVLLVMRFQEIAIFATSGAPKLAVLFFASYSLPHLLPYAIPISCLIGAILLFQKLSHTHELTAFRASGLGLNLIVFPLLFIGAVLSLLNLTISSELAPYSRSRSKLLIYEMTAVNPLLLLQKEKIIKIKDLYFDMKSLESGKSAQDVIAIVNNRGNGRLGILTARELALEGDMLTGKSVSWISSVDPKREDDFDHLVIENQATMRTKAANLSRFIIPGEGSSSFDYSTMRALIAREIARENPTLAARGPAIQEIARRVTLGIAAFSFTLIGVAFGMEISRNRSKKGILWALGLGAGFMFCFIAAKSFRHSPYMATLIYLLPHPVIFIFSLRSFKRVSAGIE